WAGGGHTHAICPLESINLRGAHNRLNVLAACAIAGAAGADPPAMAAAIAAFTGVPHRLEPVAVKNGVTYINDSIATSPERLIAALNAFAEPIILLAGGKDKDLPWDSAARLILRRVKILLLFGQAQDLILKAVKAERTASHRLKIISCRTLEQAVAQAQQLAQPGDVVLLSPGGTSYDAYPDFAARGEHFKALVG
ncbi:MAG: glutamate ligase domain-containing protein, partial [Anaerolineae bacterium]